MSIRRDMHNLLHWTDQEVRKAYDEVQNKDAWQSGDKETADLLLRELTRRSAPISIPPVRPQQACRPAPSVEESLARHPTVEDLHDWDYDLLQQAIGVLLRKTEFSEEDRHLLGNVQEEIWRRQRR